MDLNECNVDAAIILVAEVPKTHDNDKWRVQMDQRSLFERRYKYYRWQRRCGLVDDTAVSQPCNRTRTIRDDVCIAGTTANNAFAATNEQLRDDHVSQSTIIYKSQPCRA